MPRYERFTFLVDRDERQLINRMAQRLQRKPADAVRFVVLEAARALGASNTSPDQLHAQPSQTTAPQERITHAD
jgi:hypothetical protein